MMQLSQPEDFSPFTARIVVVGVGSLGAIVLEKCRMAELQVELVSVLSDLDGAERESGTLPALQGEPGVAIRPAPDGASLLFIAGALNGELEEALRRINPILPEQTQAIVVVAALPPSFEGHGKRVSAVTELENLTASGATIVVFDSDLVLREMDPTNPLGQYNQMNAALMAMALQAVVDLVIVTGEVNVDFADILLVLPRGTAGFFATGRASGQDRAAAAAIQTLANAAHFPAPRGAARACMINITGGITLTIEEVTTIASLVQEAAGDEADIIFGAVHDAELTDTIVVSTIWTGYQPSTLSYSHGYAVLAASKQSTVPPGSWRRRIASRSVRVFLASPSDVADEREVAKRVIEELNLQNASRWGTYLELVRWETHAVPAMGRAQEIVATTADLADIDIFVGLLWSRLGTPTGEAESGTVEEFNAAYASWRRHGRPWIAFYFCDRPVQYSGLGGAEQLLAVARFREKFPEKGMYFTYGSVQQFEQLLLRHLLRIVEAVLDKREQ